MLSTTQVNYHKNSGCFTADASELPEQGWCHSTVELQSHVTGKVVTFRYAETKMDTTGEDVYGWYFVPVTPVDGVKELIIWND